MVTVCVASRNPVKIRGTERAFRKILGVDVEVIPIEVSTSVRQPISIDQVIKCAIERAERAREAHTCDFAVGVEAGIWIVEVRGYGQIPINTHVAAVLTKDDTLSLGIGPSFPIPEDMYSMITTHHKELSKVVEEVLGVRDIGRDIGLVGILSGGKVKREDLVYYAVAMALLGITSRYY